MKRSLLIFAISIVVGTLATISAQEKNPFKYEGETISFQFGGFVRSVVFADFNGTVPHEDFKVSLASGPGDWQKSGRLNLDASASRLTFKAIQKSKSLGNIEYYIESDFRGGGDVLRLRQAYISFKGIIFGQSWSFMADLDATAPTIDVQGVNSRTFHRTALIGYRKQLCQFLSFGVSLEQPAAKITEALLYQPTFQRAPDIPIYLMYKGEKGHLKITAINRFISIADNFNQTVVTNHGYGGQLSGSLSIAPSAKLYLQTIVGKGVARYINDLAALSFDAFPNLSGTQMESLPMYSYSLGTQIGLSKKLALSANYSQAGIGDSEYSNRDEDYLRSSYLSTTLFWKLRNNFQVAVEYLNGSRININQEKQGANRLQFMFLYKW